jgi:hypothetical protein
MEPYIEAGMIGSWVVMIWSHPSLFATCCLSLLLLLWSSGFAKMRCRERDVRRFSLGARARERQRRRRLTEMMTTTQLWSLWGWRRAQDDNTYTLNSNAFRLSTHGDDADQADFLNTSLNILNNELCLMHFWACLFCFWVVLCRIAQ